VSLERVIASSPRHLRVGPEGAGGSYELAPDLVATHGVAASHTPVLTLEGGRISVERAERPPEADLDETKVGPVYRQPIGGRLAVPTGRVFVRFAEGDRADAHRADLSSAGYDLEEVPSYAPHAAWVRPRSGRIVEGLAQLDRLRRLPALEYVEPEMITEVAPRD
jgi:hypothetical protein